MSTNGNLHEARLAKDDEFFTRDEDIHQEVYKYKDQLKGKHIYCNCDDANWSAFWWYFYSKAKFYGIASVTATCYNEKGHGEYWHYDANNKLDNNNIVAESKRRSIWAEENPGLAPACEMFDHVEHRILEGNGSFDSEECLNILKDIDIVITNPPFSLSKIYLPMMIESGKKVLVMGDKNSSAVKDIFPYIRRKEIVWGYTSPKDFYRPIDREHKNMSGKVRWFTNLKVKKRQEIIEYYCRYNPDKYPKYDNYDAINIDNWDEVPGDYIGMMGVPITFLDKISYEQFEIIGCPSAKDVPEGCVGMSKKFVEDYYSHGHTGTYHEGNRLLALYTTDGDAIVPFNRVIIRWKPEAMPEVTPEGFLMYH